MADFAFYVHNYKILCTKAFDIFSVHFPAVIRDDFKKFLKRKFVLFDLKKLIILTFYFFYGTISDNAKVCINFMEVVA